MKALLRKLLQVHTLKIILFNSTAVDSSSIEELSRKHLPAFFVFSQKVQDIKVIDTGIPVKWKERKEEEIKEGENV